MTLVRNALWLTVAQGVGMLGPVVMVPFLARALGPHGWAPVLAAQALAAWLVLILDYASDLSGTRDVARARHGDGARARIAVVFRDVQSAKVLLVPLALAIAAASYLSVPVLHGHGGLVAWAVVYAVARGLNPFWYFQGMERVRFASAAAALARALAAVAVIVVVRRPDDAWLVLAVQAAFAGAELAVLTAAVAREIPVRSFGLAAGADSLRRNLAVFGIRAVGGVYTQASTLLLGVDAAPTAVAVYGGADRIVRAAISMIQPVTQAVLPRVSHMQASDPAAARAFVDRLLGMVAVVGLAGGAVLYVLAPRVVAIFLGADYLAAVPVLRALSALLPIVGVSTVLWTWWALPFARERLVLAAVMLAAAVNLALVAVLTPRWGAAGMCAAVIAAEVVVVSRVAAAFRSAR